MIYSYKVLLFKTSLVVLTYNYNLKVVTADTRHVNVLSLLTNVKLNLNVNELREPWTRKLSEAYLST